MSILFDLFFYGGASVSAARRGGHTAPPNISLVIMAAGRAGAELKNEIQPAVKAVWARRAGRGPKGAAVRGRAGPRRAGPEGRPEGPPNGPNSSVTTVAAASLGHFVGENSLRTREAKIRKRKGKKGRKRRLATVLDKPTATMSGRICRRSFRVAAAAQHACGIE